ncbi:SGNH/GDSL hydrolase family protein [Fimbriimonas ginsengisoli]|uniref:SGNH/GDSL hydrolase family protein n=1 Tax=Fimbriimonas ginsengisoli TaxID=1005039 RepID=UPI00046CADE6|nr:SGNH/GDSL hydrolase family protein [Fimbriimonas ginsengisoli]
MSNTRAFLFLVAGLAAVAAGQAPQSEKPAPFENEIAKFEVDDLKNPPMKGGIVFVGSSSIRKWTSLQKDFPDWNVINRGFGGSAISDSVRYAHRIVTPYEPRMIVFFAGTNDLASGKSPETVFADYKAFVATIRTKLPRTPIAYISISPAPSRWGNVENVKKTNRLIQEFSTKKRHLIFIDIFPLMLDSQGQPRPELFVEDRLHMNPDGYAIWTKAVTPVIASTLKERN